MGIAGDGQGKCVLRVGNGDIDTTNKGLNLGQSVVRLQSSATGLTLGDWWTTSNAATLNSADIDLQAGPCCFPIRRFWSPVEKTATTTRSIREPRQVQPQRQ